VKFSMKKNNSNHSMKSWVQIMGVPRSGGSLLTRRLEFNPAQTGIFSLPFEFYLSEDFEMKEEFCNFVHLPEEYEPALRSGFRKIKQSPSKKYTAEEINYFMDQMKNAKWNGPRAIFELLEKMSSFFWDCGPVQLTHVVNHRAVAFLCPTGYFFSNKLNNKGVVTLRNPLDVVVSFCRKTDPLGLNMEKILRLIMLEICMCGIFIQLSQKEYPGKVFIIDLNDVVRMNECFWELIGFLEIDRTLDFAATIIGDKWEGNSMTGQIKKPAIVSHKEKYSEYLDDQDQEILSEIYQNALLAKEKKYENRFNIKQEVNLINRLLRMSLLDEKEIYSNGLKDKRLQLFIDQLKYTRINYKILFINLRKKIMRPQSYMKIARRKYAYYAKRKKMEACL